MISDIPRIDRIVMSSKSNHCHRCIRVMMNTDDNNNNSLRESPI